LQKPPRRGGKSYCFFSVSLDAPALEDGLLLEDELPPDESLEPLLPELGGVAELDELEPGVEGRDAPPDMEPDGEDGLVADEDPVDDRSRVALGPLAFLSQP